MHFWELFRLRVWLFFMYYTMLLIYPRAKVADEMVRGPPQETVNAAALNDQPTCSQCKGVLQYPRAGEYRCRSCGNLAQRISRFFMKGGYAELNAKFDELDYDARVDFYQKAKDSFGEKLKALMEQSVSERQTTMSSEALRGTGKYYDIEDLTSMYRTKPDTLQKIIKNTCKRWCPVKECWMYENPEYQRDVVASREHVKVEERTVKGSDARDAPKSIADAKPKAKAKSKAKADGGKPKKLTAAQLRQATNILQSVTELVGASKDITTDKEKKAMVAPMAFKKLEVAIAEGEGKLAEWTLMKESNQAWDAGTLEEAKNVNGNFLHWYEVVGKQVEDCSVAE